MSIDRHRHSQLIFLGIIVTLVFLRLGGGGHGWPPENYWCAAGYAAMIVTFALALVGYPWRDYREPQPKEDMEEVMRYKSDDGSLHEDEIDALRADVTYWKQRTEIAEPYMRSAQHREEEEARRRSSYEGGHQ